MTGTARKSAKNRPAPDLEKNVPEAARREAIEIKPMAPRWAVALLLLTLPIWFLPGLIWAGWTLGGGREILTVDAPAAFRWAVLGRLP